MPEIKPIQVNSDIALYEKVSTVAKRLRTSRGGFCEIALEFILPKLESGELIFVNGKFVPAKRKAA